MPLDLNSYRLHGYEYDFPRMLKKINAGMNAFKKGDPTARDQLMRAYMKLYQRKAFPEAAKIKGAKLLKIYYQRGSEIITLYWDWLPGPEGNMVLGMCPECFVNAPDDVDPDTQTKPTFFEERLAYIRGNPEADAKVVSFRIAYPQFTMWLDDKDRLTVREVMRCPSGRHGPEAKIIRKCDWTVRVEDGIAKRVNTRLARTTTEKKVTRGPLVIVK